MLLLNHLRKQKDAIEDILYVWSIAMYGCETWTIGEAERKRLEAFEMWCYRRMMNIKWMDRITNEEVLGRIGERRTLWKSLEEEKRSDDGAHTETRGIA